MHGRLEPFGNLAGFFIVVLGGRSGDYIRRVNSCLLVLSRLAMCRFGLAVVISYFGY